MTDKHAHAIADILKQKYGKEIANAFQTYCNEQQFDDETIILDLEDGEEATLVEEILKSMTDPQIDKPTATQLHTLLTSIIEGTFFAPTPRATIDKLIPLHEYDTTVTDNDLKYIKQLVDQQCDGLLHTTKNDKNLLIVLFLGKKHNNLPLLTYLTDSYHRFIIKQKDNTECSTSHWIEYCKKNPKSDIHQIAKKPKGDSILMLYTSAINSYCSRMVHSPKLQTMYKINDNINDIAYYILYSYDFISNYLAQQENINNSQRIPTQIDLWIVPNSVKSVTIQSKDDYSDDDENNNNDCKTNNDMEFDIDIDKGLKYIDKKIIIEDIKARSLFARNIKTGFEQLISDRHQRLCMIIDRQKQKQQKGNISTNKKKKKKLFNIKNKNNNLDDNKIDNKDIKIGDRLYMYYLNENLNTSSFLKEDKLVCPSLISNTKRCILPDNKYIGEPITKNVYKWKHIGGFHGLKGYQFTLSFHIYSKSDIRVYLFYNSYMIRFVLSDIITLLPKFFKNPCYKDKGKDIIKMVRKMLRNERVCDKRFEQFYESLTGELLYTQI